MATLLTETEICILSSESLKDMPSFLVTDCGVADNGAAEDSEQNRYIHNHNAVYHSSQIFLSNKIMHEIIVLAIINVA
jgi:hypothetical protein